MKTGLQLIAIERQEQITKHKRTIASDVHQNRDRQLAQAAATLASVPNDPFYDNAVRAKAIHEACPLGWDKKVWEKLNRKDYKQRLIIAGALIAAEIDRLNVNEEKF